MDWLFLHSGLTKLHSGCRFYSVLHCGLTKLLSGLSILLSGLSILLSGLSILLSAYTVDWLNYSVIHSALTKLHSLLKMPLKRLTKDGGHHLLLRTLPKHSENDQKRYRTQVKSVQISVLSSKSERKNLSNWRQNGRFIEIKVFSRRKVNPDFDKVTLGSIWKCTNSHCTV